MPTTTTGIATEFIQFTRASNATVTDSDGKIKWAPHNLLTNSESFDASSWSKPGATITSNTHAAPNGTTTADTIAFLSGNRVVFQNNTFPSGATATMGVWVRSVSGTTDFRLVHYNGTTSLFTGNLTATTTWQYFTASWTGTGVGGNFGIATTDTAPSASTVVAWGAHLYRSDLGGMQPNTSAYPMYNPTTPKNLLGQTEAFDVSPWANTGTGGTGVAPVVTANAGLAPNGLQTADRIQFSLAGGTTTSDISRRIQQFSTISGTPYTFSMWVKSYDGNPYTMHLVAASGLTINTVSVTNEWQRISTTANGFGGNVSFAIGLRGGQTPANSNTADILVWGAQLSDSASLDAYSPVYGAAVTSAAYYGPRRDFDPVTLACKGLLVEEQRVNLLLHSAAFNTTWSILGPSASIGVDSIASPSGQSTADALIEGTVNGYQAVQQVISTTGGLTYSASCFVKAGVRNFVLLDCYEGASTYASVSFNLTTGVVHASAVAGAGYAFVGTPVVTPYGNGWYRCSFAFVAGSVAPVRFAICASNTGSIGSFGVADGYLGTNNNALYLWGAQLEANASFATSYIPVGSTTAGATRLADVASVSTQAFPYSSTEGTLVVNASLFGVGVGTSSGIVSLTNGTSAENMAIFRTSSVNNIRFEIRDNSSSQASYDVAMGTQPIRAALAYAENNSNAALNGTAQTTDTTCTMPTVTTLQIGAIYTGGDYPTNGWIRQITYLPRRISNAELQTRTA